MKQRLKYSQAECQAKCEKKDVSECVGILYSPKQEKRPQCILCIDDKLTHIPQGHSFYRRPGNYNF